MKANIHPKYQTVVFHDTTANTYYKVGSTIKTNKTIHYEGQEYPYVTIEVSGASHPVYTGKEKQIANEGRVARFKNQFGKILKSQLGNNKE